MTKKLEEGITEMCNLSKGIEDKGFQKGIEQGLLLAIQSLMRSKHLTVEEAMAALEIDESKRSEYVKKLNIN